MNVLVVDDSKAMRMIVIRTLKQAGFSGHTFSEAENGQQALEMIREQTPDLVLSDWNMPEMDGFELLCAVNKESIQVRFGFITSESTEDARQKAIDEGAEFFITKPFSADSFEAELGPVLC